MIHDIPISSRLERSETVSVQIWWIHALRRFPHPNLEWQVVSDLLATWFEQFLSLQTFTVSPSRFAGIVELLPLWLAPNLITLIGVSALVLAYVVTLFHLPGLAGIATDRSFCHAALDKYNGYSVL